VTVIPERTGSVQARTFGTPSTSTRQFGHRPAQQRSPRGRWYLKLRLTIRTPAAWSAEPTVSPLNALTLRPANVNSSGFERSMR
jgi:hypothetical protein